MEITIKIDAPGLEGAIHTLAQVLANYELPVNVPSNKDATETIEQPAPQPVQQAPQTQAPVQQQSAPAQQQPQAVPVQQPQQAPQQPAQQPNQGQQAPQQPAQQSAVPTSNPEYTMDQLAVAATQLTDAGRTQEVVNLLGQFGVQALTMLPKEQYGAFATKLREMGAKI